MSAAAEHPAATFVHTQLRDDTSPLIVTVEWILSSKFREAESVRAVLEAIGSVEVEHATFGSAVEFLRGDEKTARAAVARAVVLGVHEAQLLAVCPAGADVDARFNGVVVAADIVDAFAG